MGDVIVKYDPPDVKTSLKYRELLEKMTTDITRSFHAGGAFRPKPVEFPLMRRDDLINCRSTIMFNEEGTRRRKMYGEYGSLVHKVMDGPKEKNARTGVEIRMMDRPYSFDLDLSDGRLPVPDNRRYYPHIAATEVAWQFMGTQDPDFVLERAPKLWSKFVEDDKLKTAYGYRWQHHFGRNQLQLAVEELCDNPTNRQLYVSAWDPASDGLGGPQPKNIPCPVGFSLTRVENAINAAVFIRSSDVFVGLPYDVMGYALTLDAICSSVADNVRPGHLHFTLAHPHIYKPHWEDVKKSEGTRTGRHDVEPTLPGWDIDMILADPDGYIRTVKRLTNRVYRPEWDPMPEIVE